MNRSSALAPIAMRFRDSDPRFPKGWYCVAESADLSIDTLAPVSWLDQQLVVYRTAAGAPQVADAYCPHLGAHLASHDGAIKDGVLICPFHKWHWDGDTGKCTHIPYASQLPPGGVRLSLHPTREVDGMVLMWYHPEGFAVEFEPYSTSADGMDLRDWVLYDARSWTSTCPFRDILENVFDSAHIVQLHHATKMPVMNAMEARPHGLFVDYQLDPEAEDTPIRRLALNFTGVSGLTQLYEGEGWSALFLITLTPVDHEHFVQKARLYLKDMGSSELHERFGKPFVERFVYEVEQDFKVLNYKRHLPTPRLCRGDGPIYQFREYASQYYCA